MPNFGVWLHNFEPAQQSVQNLRSFANANTAWPYWSDQLADYIAVIRASTAAQPQQDALIATLSQAYADWKADQPKTNASGSWPAGTLGKFVLVLFGIAFVVLLWRGVFHNTLDNAEQVRGMVTFFFVLVTTSVILLIALGIFWIQEDSAVKVRFEAAKDLLTMVIGVLGTIMGFYFGSATGAGTPLTLVSAAFAPMSIQPGAASELTADVVGGTKPYKYTIAFTAPSGTITDAEIAQMTPKPGTSSEGKIAEKLTVPAAAKSALVAYTLTVTDSKSTSTTSKGTIFVEPKKN